MTQLPPPPRSPLFPYTTLFRSTCPRSGADCRHERCDEAGPATAGAAAVAVGVDRAGAGGGDGRDHADGATRSEEHTSELQSRGHLVCRLLLEKKKEKEQHTHAV